MKRLVAAVLATAAVAAAAPPVVAQPFGPPGPGGGRGLQLRARTDQLEQRIRRGLADGSLDRREADRAFSELAAIRRMEDDLLARDRGVLSPPDREAISARLDQLERGIRWLRRNGEVGPGYGPPRGGPPGPGYGFGRDFWRGSPRGVDARIGWLEARVRRGIEDGSITRGEADRAFGSLREFRRMYSDMLARDGGRLSGRDEDFLQRRLDEISQQIRWLRTNDRRY